jgi:flagellar hook-length control protein FliK
LLYIRHEPKVSTDKAGAIVVMNMPIDTSFENMPLTKDLMSTSPGPQGGGSKGALHQQDMATAHMRQTDRGGAGRPSSADQSSSTRQSSSFPRALEQAKRAAGQKPVAPEADQAKEALKKVIDGKKITPQDLAALLAALASQLQAAAEGKEGMAGTLTSDLQQALSGIDDIEGLGGTSDRNPLIALIERALDLLGTDGLAGPASHEDLASFKNALHSLLDEMSPALETDQNLSEESKGLIRTLLQAADDPGPDSSNMEDKAHGNGFVMKKGDGLAGQITGKAETAPSAGKVGPTGDEGHKKEADRAVLDLLGTESKKGASQAGAHKFGGAEKAYEEAGPQGMSPDEMGPIKNFTDKGADNEGSFPSKKGDETIEEASADRAAGILDSKKAQAPGRSEAKHGPQKEALDADMDKVTRATDLRPGGKSPNLTGAINRGDNHSEGMGRSLGPSQQPDGAAPFHTANINQGLNSTGSGAQNDLQTAGVKLSVSHQLSQGISEAIRFNRNRAVLHLNPPELGRVRVSLSVTGGSHVNATFIAEHPETRQIIEAGMAQLR